MLFFFSVNQILCSVAKLDNSFLHPRHVSVNFSAKKNLLIFSALLWHIIFTREIVILYRLQDADQSRVDFHLVHEFIFEVRKQWKNGWSSLRTFQTRFFYHVDNLLISGRQFTLFSIISFPDDLCETNNAKIGWSLLDKLLYFLLFEPIIITFQNLFKLREMREQRRCEYGILC